MSKLKKIQLNLYKEMAVRSENVIAFSGQASVITPGELLFDKLLSDGDKIFWCQLRMLCSHVDGIYTMPDLSDIANAINKSRSSILNYIKMLRATRWLSIIHSHDGSQLGYLLRDAPLSIEQTLLFDTNYLQFLRAESNGKLDRLTALCTKLIRYIDINQLSTTNASVKNLTDSQSVGSKSHAALSEENSIESIELKPEITSEQSQNDIHTDMFVKNLTNSRQKFDEAVKNLTEPCQKFDELNFEAIPDEILIKNAGYIYNRAYAPARLVFARAHPRKEELNLSKINLITPSLPSKEGGMEGGSTNSETSQAIPHHFAYFNDDPSIMRMVREVEYKLGKKTTHALLNRIKLMRYSVDNQDFVYRCTIEDAEIILMSLYDNTVRSPLAYVDNLIAKAYRGELVFRGTQLQRYREITGQIESAEAKAKRAEEEQKLHEERQRTAMQNKREASAHIRITKNTVITCPAFPHVSFDTSAADDGLVIVSKSIPELGITIGVCDIDDIRLLIHSKMLEAHDV